MQGIPARCSICELADACRVSVPSPKLFGLWRETRPLKQSNDLEALHLDRIVALAAGAIVMAHLNEVLAGDEISADQRIGIDAGIVVLDN